MRIVVMGTAAFAVPTLRMCLEAHDVAAVVTQPSRAGHRGAPAPRPLRDVADAAGIPVHAPERIRAPGAVAEVLAHEPDVVVVAAYGQILPAALLDTPRFGAVNVHASLLPRWRGAAPVAHAILAGDTETGVSIMRMDPGLDTGPVYRRASVPLRGDATTPALTEQLAALGASVLRVVLADIERGAADAEPQDEARATSAPRLRREDGELDWATSSALDIDRHVRALQPWPGTSLPLADVRLRVLSGAVHAQEGMHGEPGTPLQRIGESVVVAAREGAYRLDTVLPPGSRPMSAAAFLRGRRVRVP